MKPLALLGGTFDPVHIGHLNAAWEAGEMLDAEVALVPASTPPHRPPPRAGAAERVALLRAALAGQERLRLDTRELEREGPSYTVDTLAGLRDEVGERPLVLLLGADAFAGLPTWDRWTRLFELAHIGVLTRPGHADRWPETLARVLEGRMVDVPGRLRDAPAGLCIRLPITPLEISATRLRQLLAEGRDPRYLLPAGVMDQPALLRPYRARPTP